MGYVLHWGALIAWSLPLTGERPLKGFEHIIVVAIALIAAITAGVIAVVAGPAGRDHGINLFAE